MWCSSTRQMNEQRAVTWLTLVKPRPSQCTCSTPSLTSHVHGSKHGSSTSSSELSTRGVCVEVGVGVGVCDARDRHTHPRATARATHCILLLLPLSLAAWGYGPTSALHRTARRGMPPHPQTVHSHRQTHTHKHTHTWLRETGRKKKQKSVQDESD